MGGCDEGQVVQFVLGELSVCVCMCGGLLLTSQDPIQARNHLYMRSRASNSNTTLLKVVMGIRAP